MMRPGICPALPAAETGSPTGETGRGWRGRAAVSGSGQASTLSGNVDQNAEVPPAVRLRSRRAGGVAIG